MVPLGCHDALLPVDWFTLADFACSDAKFQQFEPDLVDQALVLFEVRIGERYARRRRWLVIFTDLASRGRQRLRRGIRRCRLMAELDLFVGSTPQHDDVTCMLLKAGA